MELFRKISNNRTARGHLPVGIALLTVLPLALIFWIVGLLIGAGPVFAIICLFGIISTATGIGFLTSVFLTSL